MKNWIEQFFDVKVKGTNSSRIANKNRRKKKKLNLNLINQKKMIVKLKQNYSIPLFFS